MRRLATTAVMALLLAVPASAHAVPTDNNCLVWAGKYTLVEQSKFAVVFSKTNVHVNSAGPAYYACVFSREKSYVLPRLSEGATPGPFLLAGRFVGYSQVSRDPAVSDFTGALLVVDAKTGKTVVEEPAWPDPVAPPQLFSHDVTDFVLRSDGSVAWIAERPGAPTVYSVQAVAAGGAKRELDRGVAIGPHSIALSRDGTTVFWVDSGSARAGSLGG